MQTTFSFTPGNFDWAPVSNEITILGEQSGHQLNPDTITLRNYVQGPVTPAPRFLYLGIASPLETVRKTVQLTVSGCGTHTAKITSPTDMIAAPEKIPGTDNLALQVTWTPSKRLGSMSGETLIELDHPEKGTLRIPVVGLVERS